MICTFKADPNQLFIICAAPLAMLIAYLLYVNQNPAHARIQQLGQSMTTQDITCSGATLTPS